MNDYITLTIDNETKTYPKGISLEQISKDYQTKQYPLLAAIVDNELTNLETKLDKDSTITFIDRTTRLGELLYKKGLIFLLIYATKLLHGNKENLRVSHSIGQGVKITSKFKLTENSLQEIKNKMQELVNQKLPFQKYLVSKKEADKYFTANCEYSKKESLKYISNHYINLYKLDKMYDYFYIPMPLDTSVFTEFDLQLLNESEFVLLFPTIANNLKIPSYSNIPKIMQAYQENYDLANKLNIFNVADLNRAITENKINDIIHLNEVISNNNLLQLAKTIYEKKDTIKLILIAGPSSSGKTTTAKKLAMFLKSFGINPVTLSIDNYFLNREKTPKLPNGKYDYESINAVDLELFHDQLKEILNKEEVPVPTFNFQTGLKEYKGNKIKMKDNDILIIEGLHGLNEKLTSNIPKENKYKVYVSPLIDLNIDDYNTVSTSDLRLIRRIIRDHRTRNYSASETINNFEEVRLGEEANIFPFQQDADFVYNTALIYEIGVLKLYTLPLLYAINQEEKSYTVARRLIDFLNMFLDVAPDSIPQDSILREFIGNSYFEEV